MRTEVARLESFEEWPKPIISPENLASAGFYYTHESDTVCCAFCSLRLSNWEEHDDPKEKHKTHTPSCSFVRSRFVGNRWCNNVPITEEERQSVTLRSLRISSTVHRYKGYGVKYREGNEEELESLNFGILEEGKAVYPKFVDKSKRLKTFRKWPVGLKIRPRALCEAGLFYTWTSDETTCFQCGVELHNWEDGDDPWVLHAKYSPDCKYVLSVKGLSFVTSVTKNIKPFVENTKELSEIDENNTRGPETDTSVTELCNLCCLAERTTVLLPCAHLVSCVTCATKLTICPVCRGDIKATLRVFPVN